MTLTDWQWHGSSFSDHNGPCVVDHYAGAVPAIHLPALVAMARHLEDHDFIFHGEPVKVFKTITRAPEGDRIAYTVNHRAIFDANFTDAQFIVRVEGQGATLEAALAGATAVLDDLIYTGDPVPGGKGQLKRCQEIADDLFQKHGHLLGDRSAVVIPYATAGGRGGWKTKTARRRFTPATVPA